MKSTNQLRGIAKDALVAALSKAYYSVSDNAVYILERSKMLMAKKLNLRTVAISGTGAVLTISLT